MRYAAGYRIVGLWFIAPTAPDQSDEALNPTPAHFVCDVLSTVSIENHEPDQRSGAQRVKEFVLGHRAFRFFVVR
jgi:hypothetical protein